MLYEGKAKQVFATDNPDQVVVRFKDDATAFNAQKRGSVDLKGEMNNAITTLIFEYLNEKGIKTHFIKQLDEREQLVKKSIYHSFGNGCKKLLCRKHGSKIRS